MQIITLQNKNKYYMDVLLTLYQLNKSITNSTK